MCLMKRNVKYRRAAARDQPSLKPLSKKSYGNSVEVLLFKCFTYVLKVLCLVLAEVCCSQRHGDAVHVLPAHPLPVERDGLLPLLRYLWRRFASFNFFRTGATKLI